MDKNHAFQEMMTSTCDPDNILHSHTLYIVKAGDKSGARTRSQRKGDNLPFSHVVPGLK